MRFCSGRYEAGDTLLPYAPCGVRVGTEVPKHRTAGAGGKLLPNRRRGSPDADDVGWVYLLAADEELRLTVGEDDGFDEAADGTV